MKPQDTLRQVIFWIVIALFAVLIWAVVRSNTGEQIRQLTLTQFLDELDKDNIRQVNLTASDDSGMLSAIGSLRKGNEPFSATLPQDYPDLYRTLREKKVEVSLHAETWRSWLGWFAYYLPFAVLIGMWIYFMRQLREALRAYRPPPGPGAPASPER
jgi:cell division protease FtsH